MGKYYLKYLAILFILAIIIIYSYINKDFIFCNNCLHGTEPLNSKCFECSNEMIFKGLKIYTNEETLDEIINNKKSISRFGDGEFNIIFGNKIDFQDFDISLSNQLFKVLNSNEKGLLIGINIPWKNEILNKYITSVKSYWEEWFIKNKFKVLKIINKRKKYYSSDISRFYLKYKDKSNIPKYITKVKEIWNNKDILIIEGEYSRLGVGNDLFKNTKSIKRIICPSKNAYKIKNKIINEILIIDKNVLILIALGPTATILSYDLYKLGYQVIDIGHIDIEYEWYLRNATNKIKIENKFVNEVIDGNKNISDIKDVTYYSQIIKKIIL